MNPSPLPHFLTIHSPTSSQRLVTSPGHSVCTCFEWHDSLPAITLLLGWGTGPLAVSSQLLTCHVGAPAICCVQLTKHRSRDKMVRGCEPSRASKRLRVDAWGTGHLAVAQTVKCEASPGLRTAVLAVFFTTKHSNLRPPSLGVPEAQPSAAEEDAGSWQPAPCQLA